MTQKDFLDRDPFEPEKLDAQDVQPDEPFDPEAEDVDSLIRSVREEIDHADALMQPDAPGDNVPEETEEPASAEVQSEQPIETEGAETAQSEQPVDTQQTLRLSDLHPSEPDLTAETRVLPVLSDEQEQQLEQKPERPRKKRQEKEAEPRQKHQRLSPAQRALLYVFCVITAAVLLAVAAWYCALDVLALTKPDREVTITIDEGDTVADVTQKLYDNDLIDYKWLFRIYCWMADAENTIDPGVYVLNNLYDYHALVNGLNGHAETRTTKTVIIPEGFECEDIFERLAAEEVCSYEDLVETASNYEFDYDFLSHLPYGEANRLEGYLFPDTYEFYVGDDPVAVLEKFLDNFERRFDEELRAGIDALNETLRAKMLANGFTEEEIEANLMDEEKIVIVASLIEKETAGASESATIASVIYNRLCSKVYPFLQLDATIQYILDERKTELTVDDLAIDSPYNTYLHPGLPPAPIANPGLSSLEAAVNPAVTDYYFYALDTDGTHHFSSSYYEHQEFLESLENDA